MGGRGGASPMAATRPVQLVQPVAPQVQQQAPPQQQAQVQQPVTPQPQPNAPQAQRDAQGFSNYDSADFHDLYNGRQYYQQQTQDIDMYMALQDYLQDQPTPGSMYSPSQQLNYKLRQGVALDGNEQFMYDTIKSNMHNLGYNTNLVRYDRVGFMENMLGIKNYQNMTQQQLSKAAKGKSYIDKAIVSTSYNDFKTAPAGNAFTDKAVEIRYRAKASTQAYMPGNGPGGRLGEMLLAPGQKYTVDDIKFTGTMGRSGAQRYKKVIVYVTVG